MSAQRLLEMLDAERARLGQKDTAPLTAESPFTVKASILATFIIEIDLLCFLADYSPKEKAIVRELCHFVFLIGGLTPILKDPAFQKVYESARKDYQDALSQ